MTPQGAEPSGGDDRHEIPRWRRLHWRLFAAHFVLIVFVLGALGIYLLNTLEGRVSQYVTQQLEKTAAMTALALEPALAADQDSQALLERMRDDSDLRATLIASDGTVVADSDVSPGDVSHMDNHGNRPEVIQALTAGSGFDRRVSATLGEEFAYAARTIDVAGDTMIVRIAIPWKQFSSRLPKTAQFGSVAAIPLSKHSPTTFSIRLPTSTRTASLAAAA